MRRLRNSRRGGDTLDVDESYQGDAIVSLFAVLLVLLLTLAAASSQSAEPVQTRYKPNDQTGEVLSLRSLQVPFKFREFWSLGEEELLIRYDMEAIIDRLLGEIGTSRTETTIDGVDINFEWFETELGGYRIELNIFDLNAGQWAVLDSVNARDNEALAEWASKAGDQGAAVAADLADRDGMEQTCAAIKAPFGAPDILVHAAGLNTREAADDVTPQGWDQTLAINLSAPFFLTQAFAPAMAAKGWGRVVNFASLQSTRAFPGGIAYGATKGGVTQLTRAMAEAWSSKGIMVNAIGPGPTLRGGRQSEAHLAKQRAATLLERGANTSDITAALGYFLDAPAVTGQLLCIDGGQHLAWETPDVLGVE